MKYPDTDFEYEKLLDKYHRKEAIIKDVLIEFIETTKNQISKIQEYLKNGEYDSIKFEAHSIKGASWNLCAYNLGNIAYKLEDAGLNKDDEEITQLLDEIKKNFKTLEQEINKNLKG